MVREGVPRVAPQNSVIFISTELSRILFRIRKTNKKKQEKEKKKKKKKEKDEKKKKKKTGRNR